MISTLVLDLETSALEADRGVVLCGSYESSKEPGRVRTVRTDHTNKGWALGRRGNDKETIKALMAVVADHDVIVAHNGTFFDLPFLRTRALFWGLRPLRDVKHVDPCSIARRKFRLRSNSLGVVADYAGVKDRKTPLDMSVWADAVLNGSPRAMAKIVAHCEADVRVLSALLGVVKPYIRLLDDRGSAL